MAPNASVDSFLQRSENYGYERVNCLRGYQFVVAADPCLSLPDGDYPLDDRFRGLLPGVNARCNFIKCAHRSTFVNACSTGTRNPDHDLGLNVVADLRTTGAHYCSVRDVGYYCGQHYHHPTTDIDVKNSDYDEDQLHTNVKHYYVV